MRSSTTSQFVSLLDSFGLVEQIRQPARGAHQLDVFLSRSDGPDLVLRVDPSLMSDHSLIVTSFDVNSEHTVHLPTVTRRRWRLFNFDDLVADLQQSPLVRDQPCDVTELYDLYDNTPSCWTSTLLQQLKLRLRPTAPRFDAECRVTKAKTRKLEGLLWSKLRSLLEPKPSNDSTLTGEDIPQYFTLKIDKIRASTATSPPPRIEDHFVPELLFNLRPATVNKVARGKWTVILEGCMILIPIILL